MTKDTYYQMCEALGNPPVESQIPIEFEDFPAEIQQSFELYQVLQDVWEGMSGTYMGKNMSGIDDLLNIYQIPQDEKRFILELIALIDSERMKQMSEKRKQEESLKSSKSPP
jgi:hypothetical protein